MTQSRWIVDKTEVTAKHGLVVTKDQLASEAGVSMLKQGGNAIDAAVAAAFAIGVVEPWMNGIGGGGFMVVHLGKEKRTIVIDYAMRSPGQADPSMFELAPGKSADIFGWPKVKDDANLHGWRSVAVPGAVAGLCYALERFGTLPLRSVLAPAISLAHAGFPVSWHTQLIISSDAQVLSRYPETSRTFFTNGLPKAVPHTGVELIRQPELARTLETIAAEGPDAFYRGTIAEQIARGMAEHGGLMTTTDLANYQLHVLDPAPVVGYGRDQVYTSPCPSGGTTLQETLAILDGLGLAEAGHNSADALHLIAEASRLAWADRFAHLTDSEQMAFPWQTLFDSGYAAERRRLIQRDRAMEDVMAGSPAGFAGQVQRSSPDGSTTALVTADGDQNVVSITQTLLSVFGSRVTVPGTGIIMNNGMFWFDPEPGKANSVGPHKKPLNNMAPLIAVRDGAPFLAISSSGGRRIPGANLNLYLNAAAFGLGMQQAVSSPRIDLSEGHLIADDRIAAATIDTLRRRGHQVTTATEAFRPRQFASPTCIRIDPETGLLTSGTDPFHPAVAIGI